MQKKEGKCINIQNRDCNHLQVFFFLFSKISRVQLTIFVNNS